MDYSQLIDGCSHFTWGEGLYLPSWKTYHIPTEEEETNLIRLFQKLEEVRNYLGSSINVHCAIRPILNNPSSQHHGQDYNEFCDGATHSAHKIGLAVDFDVSGMTCDTAKAKLMQKLVEFNIRMENNGPGSSWVHIDLMYPKPNRYFVP